MAKKAKKKSAAKKVHTKSALDKKKEKIGKQESFIKRAREEFISILKQQEPGKKAVYDVRIQSRNLGEAPKEYHFVLKSGQKLKSIQEMAKAMETMGEDVFRHHVTDYKNDFAKWVNDVFNEKTLAMELGRIKNKTETELKLLRHVAKKLTQ